MKVLPPSHLPAPPEVSPGSPDAGADMVTHPSPHMCLHFLPLKWIVSSVTMCHLPPSQDEARSEDTALLYLSTGCTTSHPHTFWTNTQHVLFISRRRGVRVKG